VATYLLAMFLPSVAYQNYLFHGWEVTYLCGLLSFAQSMDLGDRTPFIVGTLSNLLFLFGITLFLGRIFLHWSWPRDIVICLISAPSLVFSVISASMASMWQNNLLVGSYFWVMSTTLLLLGSLYNFLRQRKVTKLSNPK